MLTVSLAVAVPSLTTTREARSVDVPEKVPRNWISEDPDDEFVTVTEVLPMDPS